VAQDLIGNERFAYLPPVVYLSAADSGTALVTHMLAIIALIVGLLLFLGAHSVRIVAEDWRRARIARLGPGSWKRNYAILSLVGFGLMVWGYGEARVDVGDLWAGPHVLRIAAAVLMLVAFVLLAAVYVPRNRIKPAVGHPMVVATQLWAVAHLLTNTRVVDLLLFGSLLLWALLSFRAARARDRANPPAPVAATWGHTLLAIVVGAAGWLLFAAYLHPLLIGVPAA
jgi:uncharacterized membrane protein